MNAHLLYIVVAAILSFHGMCFAENYAGRIVGVIDGDTVDLLTEPKELIRVRLSGVDAPEKKQAFGNVAKAMLAELVFDRHVVILGHKRDRWGRLIGKVMVSGENANLQMVKRGLAWHYKKYEKEQTLVDQRMYADAELIAKAKHLGLWADHVQVPPWEFRGSKPLRGQIAGPQPMHGIAPRGETQGDRPVKLTKAGLAASMRPAELP